MCIELCPDNMTCAMYSDLRVTNNSVGLVSCPVPARDCPIPVPDPSPVLPQEAQQGSYLYQQVIKNKVQTFSSYFRLVMLKRFNKKPTEYSITESE